MKKPNNMIPGLAVGIVNALFGAGGGMIAVPLIKRKGKTQKEAQASAIAVILPLCALSAAVYYYRGYYNLSDAMKYIPISLAGALLGTLIFRHLPDRILKKIFSIFMFYLGLRMVIK